MNKLANDGFVTRVERGLYRPTDVAQGQIAFMTDEQRKASRTTTLAAVQTARAREIELRVARQAHKLIATDEAIACVDEIVGALKADCDGLPAAVTRDADLRVQIESKLDDIFSRAADRLQQKSRALRASGDVSSSDTADDAGSMGEEESKIPAKRRRSRAS